MPIDSKAMYLRFPTLAAFNQWRNEYKLDPTKATADEKATARQISGRVQTEDKWTELRERALSKLPLAPTPLPTPPVDMVGESALQQRCAATASTTVSVVDDYLVVSAIVESSANESAEPVEVTMASPSAVVESPQAVVVPDSNAAISQQAIVDGQVQPLDVQEPVSAESSRVDASEVSTTQSSVAATVTDSCTADTKALVSVEADAMVFSSSSLRADVVCYESQPPPLEPLGTTLFETVSPTTQSDRVNVNHDTASISISDPTTTSPRSTLSVIDETMLESVVSLPTAVETQSTLVLKETLTSSVAAAVEPTAIASPIPIVVVETSATQPVGTTRVLSTPVEASTRLANAPQSSEPEAAPTDTRLQQVQVAKISKEVGSDGSSDKSLCTLTFREQDDVNSRSMTREQIVVSNVSQRIGKLREHETFERVGQSADAAATTLLENDDVAEKATGSSEPSTVLYMEVEVDSGAGAQTQSDKVKLDDALAIGDANQLHSDHRARRTPQQQLPPDVTGDPSQGHENQPDLAISQGAVDSGHQCTPKPTAIAQAVALNVDQRSVHVAREIEFAVKEIRDEDIMPFTSVHRSTMQAMMTVLNYHSLRVRTDQRMYCLNPLSAPCVADSWTEQLMQWNTTKPAGFLWPVHVHNSHWLLALYVVTRHCIYVLDWGEKSLRPSEKFFSYTAQDSNVRASKSAQLNWFADQCVHLLGATTKPLFRELITGTWQEIGSSGLFTIEYAAAITTCPLTHWRMPVDVSRTRLLLSYLKNIPGAWKDRITPAVPTRCLYVSQRHRQYQEHQRALTWKLNLSISQPWVISLQLTAEQAQHELTRYKLKRARDKLKRARRKPDTFETTSRPDSNNSADANKQISMEDIPSIQKASRKWERDVVDKEAAKMPKRQQLSSTRTDKDNQ